MRHATRPLVHLCLNQFKPLFIARRTGAHRNSLMSIRSSGSAQPPNHTVRYVARQRPVAGSSSVRIRLATPLTASVEEIFCVRAVSCCCIHRVGPCCASPRSHSAAGADAWACAGCTQLPARSARVIGCRLHLQRATHRYLGMVWWEMATEVY